MWAAGVKATGLGARLGEQSAAVVDRSGRVFVLADCTLLGHPEVFVIGDLMSLNNLPGVAEVAMQSGRHAAHRIVRRLRGDDTTRAFGYRDLGTMATVARFRAVAWFGPLRLAGPVAWLLWLVIHLAFLTGFKNRVATLASWTVAFLGRGRPRAHDHRATGLRPNTQPPPCESSEPRDDGSSGRVPASGPNQPRTGKAAT